MAPFIFHTAVDDDSKFVYNHSSNLINLNQCVSVWVYRWLYLELVDKHCRRHGFFLITRYWFQDFFAKYVNSQWESKIEENGFGVVFIGRVMPFMPTSVVNIAAAISSIRFMKFFYATVLGNMIYFFILSSISLGILSIPWENSLYVVSAAFALLVIMVIRKRRKKAGRTPMTPPE